MFTKSFSEWKSSNESKSSSFESSVLFFCFFCFFLANNAGNYKFFFWNISTKQSIVFNRLIGGKTIDCFSLIWLSFDFQNQTPGFQNLSLKHSLHLNPDMNWMNESSNNYIDHHHHNNQIIHSNHEMNKSFDENKWNNHVFDDFDNQKTVNLKS